MHNTRVRALYLSSVQGRELIKMAEITRADVIRIIALSVSKGATVSIGALRKLIIRYDCSQMSWKVVQIKGKAVDLGDAFLVRVPPLSCPFDQWTSEIPDYIGPNVGSDGCPESVTHRRSWFRSERVLRVAPRGCGDQVKNHKVLGQSFSTCPTCWGPKFALPHRR